MNFVSLNDTVNLFLLVVENDSSSDDECPRKTARKKTRTVKKAKNTGNTDNG